MTEDRIHRAVSADGTEIAGRVQGEGPPLVLVHAPPHDAALAWEALLPHLTARFTCFAPNLRGRGPSGDSPDHSPPRFREDVTAFVESIGEPVPLVGWSDGSALALHAAAHSESVAAVVAYEPAVWPLMREDDLAAFGAVAGRQGEAVAAGRLDDAARIFHRFIGNDDELAALDPDYLHRQAQLFPMLMGELQQRAAYDGTEPTDPEELARVEAPVLVLLGRRTRLSTWFAESAQFVAAHVAHGHVRELPDVGHLAPHVAPASVAEELVSFLATVRQSA